MDLEGRGVAYRGTTVRCPGCGAAMRCEAVPSAEVDVCDSCGGLWVDWFDGNVETLALEAEALRERRGEPVSRSSGRSGGAGTCPRCLRALGAQLHRFSDALPNEFLPGVELLRCPECAGSFVPRSSAHLLLDRVREPRVVGLGEALVALLKRLVRGEGS